MEKSKILRMLDEKGLLVSDGATGSNLLARGLPQGSAPEAWVLSKPDEIVRLHRDFIEAGAEIILTCTFGGTRVRLAVDNLQDEVTQINQQAVRLVREAAGGTDVLVFGSIGPLGRLLAPLGDLSPEEAASAYGEQAKILSDNGVDLLLIETQYDLAEARIAIEAVNANSDLPVICSFSYDRGKRTMMGVKPGQMAMAMMPYDLLALGINCGKSIDENLLALRELRAATSLPIWFKPNAGFPTLDEAGQASYATEVEAMAAHVPEWVAAGARFIGGCCGTTPAHLKAMADTVHELTHQ